MANYLEFYSISEGAPGSAARRRAVIADTIKGAIAGINTAYSDEYTDSEKVERMRKILSGIEIQLALLS